MLKKLPIAALVAAMSFAFVPSMTSVALAQGAANEPPTAPAPDEAMKGGDASKDSMSKSGSMSSKSSMKSMKKSKKHSMKKHM
jgi:hypothetical protein